MDLLTLLPRTWPEHPAPSMTAAPADAQPVRLTRPRSILILESDPSIRKLLRRLLDRRGYFTYEVLKPEDLPAELRERRVDLLIIEDVHLEGALPRAAPAPVHPDLKILALSLGPLNGALIPGRSLALTKPFSCQIFIECVDRLLDSGSPTDDGTRL
jgi:CheY-like chemotaxis protein